MKTRQAIGLLLGILGLTIPLILRFDGLTYAGHICLGILLMGAMFWILEPIPIYSTSVLVILMCVLLLSAQGPVFMDAKLADIVVEKADQGWWVPEKAFKEGKVFLVNAKGETEPAEAKVLEGPVSGRMRVESAKLVAGSKVASDASHKLVGYKPNNFSDYFNSLANTVIILFLGGLLLADVATKYRLDANISQILLKPFGSNPSMITLGMLTATATVSAFMSNTAATAMMMAVAIPVAARIPESNKIKKALILAIPFGANIGGIATPVGTPPNAVALAALAKAGIKIPFGTWVAMAAPIALIMVLITWQILIRLFPANGEKFEFKVERKFDKSPKAIILYIIGAITVVMWVTEALHGISSTIVAFFAVVALTTTGVADERDIRRVPWDVLWLVSGGIAIDVAMKATGLGGWMVGLIGWGGMDHLMIIFIFGFIALFMSEFLSNTVCATLIVPLVLMLGASKVLGNQDMALGAIFVGIMASFAMAFPISTPPNAIATSSGMINTKDMAKSGILVGAIGITITFLALIFYWPLFIKGLM